MTIEQIAARFGCTPDQVRAQFSANAADLAKMARRASKTGRKVNNYTATRLRDLSEMASARAKE